MPSGLDTAELRPGARGLPCGFKTTLRACCGTGRQPHNERTTEQSRRQAEYTAPCSARRRRMMEEGHTGQDTHAAEAAQPRGNHSGEPDTTENQQGCSSRVVSPLGVGH